MKFKNLFIVLAFLFSSNSKSAQIVYGFSSGILPSETQEFVFRGFLLGLKKYSKISIDKDLKLLYSNSGNLTSPINVTREVLNLKPLIITGFPSSFESQLAAPILKKSKILTFFASSSNLSLKGMGENIYSSSEDILEVNRYIAKKIVNLYGRKIGGVIYNPFDYFSVNQLETWRILKNSYPELNINFIATGADGKLPQSILEQCRNYRYIVTTLFPTKSYDFFRFFDEHKIDVPVFANSAWYKMEYELLTRFLSKKKTPVYTVKFKNYDSNIKQRIIHEYKQDYKAVPLPEVYVGYDLGIIVGGVLQESRKQKISVNDIIKNGLCLSGSPFGEICLNRRGGFVSREVILENINAVK